MLQMLIPAAISTIGGLMQARSAQKAAETQARAATEGAQAQLQAAREANALQAAMYKQGLGMQAPQIRGGQLALSALMSGLGLGAATPGMARAGGAGGLVTPAVMPGGAAGAPAGTMAPAVMPGGGVPATAGIPGSFVNAQGVAVDAQGKPVAAPSDYGIGNIPIGATEEEMAAAGAPMAGRFTEEFTGQDIYMDPSYKFRLEQGMRQLRAQQAAGGNRFGGQAMKDIAEYSQGLASQEYGNAYERFMRNKQALYSRLSDLAGLGSRAGSEAAAAGTAAGGQIGANIIGGQRAATDLLTSAAAARAGGQVGSTNAIVGGINQGLNNWYMQQYMNKFQPSGGGGGGAPFLPGTIGMGGGTTNYGFSGPVRLGGGGD